MAERLTAFALGASHTALLLLAFLGVGHANGALGALLSGVGTLAGLALGVWLAVVSIAAAAWTLRDADLAALERRPLLARAMLAGGVGGSIFTAGVILGAMVSFGAFDALLFALFATVFAFPVGALVGGALALVDLGLYALTKRSLTASNA